MVLNTTRGHTITAEYELAGHPDVFSSTLAAKVVKALALETAKYESDGEHKLLEAFRADINVQTTTPSYKPKGITPITINLAGQVNLHKQINLEEVVRDTAMQLLTDLHYFDATAGKRKAFSSEKVKINVAGIGKQSPLLTRATAQDLFADSCTVKGHYITGAQAINGTYAPLIIAQRTGKALFDLVKGSAFNGSNGDGNDGAMNDATDTKRYPLHADGKVHITAKNTIEGYAIEEIKVSVSHDGELTPLTRSEIISEINRRVQETRVRSTTLPKDYFSLNSDAGFNVYFVQADAGVSKVKDAILITGGLDTIGTDAVWGKCMYKASSILLPYAFALSRAIATHFNANYVSVTARSRHNNPHAVLQLGEIDSKYESKREAINNTLAQLPTTIPDIRYLTGLKVTPESYTRWNDPLHFHTLNKPWKAPNNELDARFKRVYTSGTVGNAFGRNMGI